MKPKHLYYLLILIATGCTTPAHRTIEDLDKNWRFIQEDVPEAKKQDFNDNNWRQLEVPHDWSAEGNYERGNTPQNAWLPAGIAWYRKIFHIPSHAGDKRIFLHFDGVYMNSDVYINGQHVGNRPYGFISFQYDPPFRHF